MTRRIRTSYLYDLGKESCRTGYTQNDEAYRQYEDLKARYNRELVEFEDKLGKKIPVKAGTNADILVEALWDLAQRRGDYETLAGILATFDYLPKSCLAKAREIGVETVRCCYLNREETTGRGELLKKEKRSKVFVSVCNLAETDPEVLDAIAAQLAVKPTKILAKGILNSSISHTQTLVAALNLLAGNHDGVQSGRLDTIDKALRRSAEDFQILAKCLIDNKKTIHMASFSLDDKTPADYHAYTPTLLKWFKSVADSSIKKIRPGSVYNGDTDRWEQQSSLIRAATLLAQTLDPSLKPSEHHVNEVRAFLAKNWIDLTFVNGSDQFLGYLSKTVGYTPDYTLSAPNEAAVKAGNSKGRTLMGAVQKLTKLIEEGATRSKYGDSLIHILSNREFYTLPDTTVYTILCAATGVDLCCALTINPSVDLLADMVIEQDIVQVPEEAWPIVAPSDAEMSNILTRLLDDANKRQNEDMWRYRGKQNFLQKLNSVLSAKPSRELYEITPWEYMSNIRLTENLDLVNQMIVDAMGGDPGNWESFYDLAHDWTGSFGQLLNASVRL